MKTTVIIDDDLVKQVKHHATRSGRSLSAVVEDALRELLHQQSRRSGAYQLDLPTVDGRLQPGIDLHDRDSLYDAMERDR